MRPWRTMTTVNNLVVFIFISPLRVLVFPRDDAHARRFREADDAGKRPQAWDVGGGAVVGDGGGDQGVDRARPARTDEGSGDVESGRRRAGAVDLPADEGQAVGRQGGAVGCKGNVGIDDNGGGNCLWVYCGVVPDGKIFLVDER